MQDLTIGLNEEQKKAVLTTEGPLLIQAGAGSGKTKTLTHRFAYILENGLADTNQILAVTFTNKAAKEMRERIAVLLGQNANNRSFLPWMGTFHGVCVRLLRQDGEHIGVPRTFVIYDESDRLSAIKQEIKRLQIDDKTFPPKVFSSSRVLGFIRPCSTKIVAAIICWSSERFLKALLAFTSKSLKRYPSFLSPSFDLLKANIISR